MLCPIVVGREAELDELAARLDAALAGHGSLVAIQGDAGVGKSRLVRELATLARAQGMLVLTGRAVPASSPTPYRPLTEAFLGVSRTGVRPSGPELTGFTGPIGRLVPDWRTADDPNGEESPLLVGEAVIRLLRSLSGEHGCLLVIEDLHWADPETAAAIDYLAGAIDAEAMVCAVTARPEGRQAGELLARMRGRAGRDVMALSPLAAQDQLQMIAACLATEAPPEELCDFVTAHSDGVPFFIEELLAGLSTSGVLINGAHGWRADGALIPTVPGTLTESVRTRVEQLGARARDVLGAAALLGRRFDWSLLPGVTGTDGTAVVEILRGARAAQLIDIDGQDFRFRHALTREAMLDGLLPFERIAFARRALDAVRLAHPRLEGDHCELAAELAEVAGDRDTAANLLTESARRALDRGALDSARTAAERAVRYAVPSTPEAADALEVLVHALAHAGDAGRAADLGNALVTLLERLDVESKRVVDLHVTLARTAIAAGDNATAQLRLVAARTIAGTNAQSMARLDALAAQVAIDAEQVDEAKRLASSAAERAATLGLPDVECEALEVLARTTWHRDLPTAVEVLERMAGTAADHQLTSWRVRALTNLAMLQMEQGLAPLDRARRVAVEAGALFDVAHIDMYRAEVALGMLDEVVCNAAAESCVAASRRFGLATLPVALMWKAGAAVLQRDSERMERLLSEAQAIDPTDMRILADSWGRVHALDRLLDDDRDGLRAALDTSMSFVRQAPPMRSLFFGRATWTLLCTVDDDDLGARAREELRTSRVMTLGGGPVSLACEAVAHGRSGRPDEAERTWSDAVAAAGRQLGGFYTSGAVERFVAEAAIRDGWGRPETWLRPLEVYYADKGYDRAARACRALLVKAGAPAPRRGRGDSVVPASLRGLGVTSREMDVLVLVAKGLSNRDIAEQLVLSPRTVENHVATLLRRTNAETRADLGRLVDSTTA